MAGDAEYAAGEAAQPPGIEGVVAKRRDQRYRPGARSWQKLRARNTAEAIVGGVFGTLAHPEALVLGRYRGERLSVVGRTIEASLPPFRVRQGLA